ncbi:hypothetical protein E8Q35_12170 [Aeromonas veronii]|uniref:Uncharacterized protein n=1 Tax=Aeromonas veronii TaxID=654 RepID=A0A4S5CGZ2_AERVE|nr:hypothetical protein E8Q35_12170 [Aeromonas veronii]
MSKINEGFVKRNQNSWVAVYLDYRVAYSENRFGAMAEHLANRALTRLKSGTYDPDREDMMLRHSWPMRDAIVPLGISIGQLRHWMLTGTIEGKPITPPRRDTKGVDRISGCELIMAMERLTIARAK